MEIVDEGMLIERTRRGDKEAFGEMVRRHQARLRAYAARFVLSPEDVFDLVQDSFVDAFTNLDRFEQGRDFGAWLKGICRNRVCNYFRSRQTQRSAAQTLVDQALEMHARAMANRPEDEADERLTALRRCLERLQEAHRQIVRQRYAEGVRVKDLAERLGRSEPSVSMLLLRIRQALQNCIDGSGRGEVAG